MVKHQPVDWSTPGVYPSCSCGFDPHDNLALIAHWRDHGVRWHEDHGRLVQEDVPVSDLFTEPHGIPQFSKKFTQGWDAANAARIYAVAVTEQEVWRFAPAEVDRIEMEWVDEFDGGYLALRRMSGPALIVTGDGALHEREWDAIEGLVARLADTWDEAKSTYLIDDYDQFVIKREENF